MDYSVIFSKGTKYVEAAVTNWDRRMQKLLKVWSNTAGGFNDKTEEQSYRLIEELLKRHKRLGRMVNEYKEKQKFEKIKLDNSVIFLECTNFKCRYDPNGVDIGILYKNYNPGTHTCPKCGSELESKEERSADMLIWNIPGITFS